MPRLTLCGAAALIAAAVVQSILPQAALAQVSPDGAWTPAPQFPLDVLVGNPNVRPTQYAGFRLDGARMQASLATAPLENGRNADAPLHVSLPMPDGTWATFEAWEAPVMHPDLQARYPSIRTYIGRQINDHTATARLDLTQHGFHAQVLSTRGMICVDPYTLGNTEYYASYFAADHPWPEGAECQVTDEHAAHDEDEAPLGESIALAGPTRRTYRLAVAATGEFTVEYGGTVENAMAAIVTCVNRTTGIFEQEFSIRLQLIANNDLLVYTDGTTDPYTNNDNNAMLGQNQTNITNVIGTANFDIGHVFASNGGGVANLSSVCSTNNKARGVSTSFNGTSAPATTLTPAHEMGHQFSTHHSWNGAGGSCSAGNWGQNNAYEPGSGSTIMGYFGSCSADNLTGTRDPYFHAGSFNRVMTFVGGASGSCSVNEATGNNAPTVNAGADFTIPARTPFILTAAGTDPDADPLTYCWEQLDLGPRAALTEADNAASPIIRSVLPGTSPTRMIPRLSNLLANTTTVGEILPTTSRILNMRITARDNRVGNGGVNTDDMRLFVIGSAGPFLVTSPNTNVTWFGTRNVTWDVAGTNAPPISTSLVRILLSTDSGNTFPIVLADNTPNDGSEAVTLPAINTTTARIKVEAIGNIYFDISNSVFRITPPPAGIAIDKTGAFTLDDTAGNGSSDGLADPGESPIGLTFELVNRGLTTADVSAALSSLTPTVTVVSASSSYPSLAPGATGSNLTPYRITLSPAHPCGAAVNLRLTVVTGQGNVLVDYSIPTGVDGGLGAPQTFSYAGAPVAIPDNNTTGVDLPVTVSGVGSVGAIEFRFGGSTCSTTSGSTTVGLDHTFTGELKGVLISPTGTSAILFNAPGGLAVNSGNNLCQTLLVDTPTFAPIEGVSNAQAPFTLTLRSAAALKAFNSLPADGTWTLRISDQASGDTGSVRAFSLIIRPKNPTACTPATPLACNPADLASVGQFAPPFSPDGVLTGADFDAFISCFFLELQRADLTFYADIATNAQFEPPFTPDGGLSGADFDAFLLLFFSGC